jgi:hypothetical protein
MGKKGMLALPYQRIRKVQAKGCGAPLPGLAHQISFGRQGADLKRGAHLR